MPSRAAVYSQQTARPFFGPARPPQPPPPPHAANKPKIDRRPKLALLQLNKQPAFERTFSRLLSGLSEKADVDSVTTEAQASVLFSSNLYPIILATDQALAEPRYDALRDEARQFVQNHGGTLVFCCHFPSFVHDMDAMKLFSSFGLYWRTGEYQRAEYTINRAARRTDAAALMSRYSPEARHLCDVDPADAIYLPAPAACVQSCVWPPSTNKSQTPAALTGIGLGKLGYLGDVHGDEGTMETVLITMCGLR
ncbi:hypothetical protein SMMN14_00981 [Sphaerulina musiva]